MTDGRVITKDCPNTGHKDCWTAEYRAKTSAKRRKNGTNCKGSSCFTGKIKCKNCECNFRRATQPSATAENGKVNYWRCSEHSNGCQTAGLREDALIPLIADTLGNSQKGRNGNGSDLYTACSKATAKDRGTESTYAKPYEGKMDSGAKSRDE